MTSTEDARLAETEVFAPDKIAGWLETLALDETTVQSPITSRRAQDEEQSRSWRERPATPRQQEAYGEELSPAETSFSSVFSSPDGRDEGYNSTSPCLRRPQYASSETSATTIDQEPTDDNSVTAKDTSIPVGLTHRLDAISLISVEPPTECDEIDDSPPVSTDFDTPGQLPDYGEPRVVFITSCLQSGHGHLCLLHRRKVYEELVPGDSVGNQTPALLRLHQSWMEAEDRQNWVLPDLQTSRRGDYNTYGKHHVSRMHPGEGLGRQTFRTLELA
ncbi:hypothetical protein BDV96DRAFT_646648 [Lophiotrema nucula]|uniref:Uncharacterized protein n=1 Tax=Lophiotrema nucula TaxID=690887 RepID=A0A6A5Z6U1_9PLEO|nr:hypothetical protein BDV96DRAFT_646648 [Lophiotrema nucula]